MVGCWFAARTVLTAPATQNSWREVKAESRCNLRDVDIILGRYAMVARVCISKTARAPHLQHYTLVHYEMCSGALIGRKWIEGTVAYNSFCMNRKRQ
jgi:hypothetical protein